MRRKARTAIQAPGGAANRLGFGRSWRWRLSKAAKPGIVAERNNHYEGRGCNGSCTGGWNRKTCSGADRHERAKLRAIRFCRHVGAARHAVRHIHGVGVRGGSSLFEGDGPVREWRHDKPEHGKRGQQVPNGEMSLHVRKSHIRRPLQRGSKFTSALPVARPWWTTLFLVNGRLLLPSAAEPGS